MFFEGTENADSIVGTDGDDTIDGLGGADTVRAGAGDDSVLGGAGDDFLVGDAGNDTLDLGDSGDGSVTFDQARGGTGDDLLIGGFGGPTLLTGGAGDDTLDGSQGVSDEADYFDVGFGVDGGPIQVPGDLVGVHVDLAAGVAYDDGEGGTDTLIGIENVVGSVYNDTIIGDDTSNELRGNDGDDTLNGQAGDDNLQGGEGDDLLISGDGFDSLFGGGGADRFVTSDLIGDRVIIFDLRLEDGDILDLSANTFGVSDISSLLEFASEVPAGVRIDLDDTLVGLVGLTLANIVALDASGQIIYGTSIPGEVINGGNGNDGLAGTRGDDTLNGGNGNDSVDGDAGADVISGGNGSDTLLGGSGSDDIGGGNANDILAGGSGNDTLNGGNGNDSISGDAGADVIIGGNGSDSISGGAVADDIVGNNGNDIVDGGAGDDTLNGGNGSDTFVFGVDSGTDVVTDFNARNDVLDLSDVAIEFTDLASVQAAASENSVGGVDGILLDLGEGNSVFLADINFTDLERVDFVF